MTKFLGKVWRAAKKHPVIALCIVGLFASTFFLRAESIEIRYSGEAVYDYVRVDYSIYGYCINVVPMNEVSVDSAKDLEKILLFTGTKDTVDKIVDLWTYYHGGEEMFMFRVKGYFVNAVPKRNALIEYVKEKGFRADNIE